MEAAVEIFVERETRKVDGATVQTAPAWRAVDVQKGLDDLNAGRVISQEDVERRLRDKGFRV